MQCNTIHLISFSSFFLHLLFWLRSMFFFCLSFPIKLQLGKRLQLHSCQQSKPSFLRDVNKLHVHCYNWTRSWSTSLKKECLQRGPVFFRALLHHTTSRWNIKLQKVRAFLVCGILMKSFKKNVLKIWKKSWESLGSYLLNSTANPAHFHLNWAGLAVLFNR